MSEISTQKLLASYLNMWTVQTSKFCTPPWLIMTYATTYMSFSRYLMHENFLFPSPFNLYVDGSEISGFGEKFVMDGIMLQVIEEYTICLLLFKCIHWYDLSSIDLSYGSLVSLLVGHHLRSKYILLVYVGLLPVEKGKMLFYYEANVVW